MATSEEELLSNFYRLQVTTSPEEDKSTWNHITASNTTGNDKNGSSEWMSAIQYSEYTTNRHRRHSHYPFETKKLLHSLQQSSTNRCTKAKSRTEAQPSSVRTNFVLRPSKLILPKPSSFVATPFLARRTRKRVGRTLLDIIPEEESESVPNSTTESLLPLQQSCSHQATNNPELNINELASYFDLYLHLPKKMSAMAEMMYT